jgi:N-sulfoglucosamine sulfohydrolase
MKRAVLLTLLAGCAGGPSMSLSAAPNFLLFIADDLAWDDLGAYGHPTLRTPNIDRLAVEGMRFDRAYVTTSSCSPSRASLITGRYPHATDAEQLHWRLPPDQTTFVERLRRSGYWTAAAGKWHLGDAVKDRFDVVREADPAGFIKGAGSSSSGCEDWVRTLKERPKDKPFFLWLAAIDPHRDYAPGSFKAEDVVVPPYLPDLPEVRKDFADYYGEIERLDRFVGETLAELERQGASENTVVIFLSDNGRPFPRCKTTLYDSGIRTPLIVRWPARIAAGSVCGSLVSTVDVAPTLLSLAAVEAPPTLQGRSFAPLLENPGTSIREHVFAEKNWHDYEDRSRAVRTLKYKYIRNDYPDLAGTPPADGVRSPTFQAMRRLRDAGRLEPEQRQCFGKRPEEELYDLEGDPHELQNLAADSRYARILDRLQDALEAWEASTQDAKPGARTPDEFDRETGDPLPNRARPRPSKK